MCEVTVNPSLRSIPVNVVNKWHVRKCAQVSIQNEITKIYKSEDIMCSVRQHKSTTMYKSIDFEDEHCENTTKVEGKTIGKRGGDDGDPKYRNQIYTM